MKVKVEELRNALNLLEPVLPKGKKSTMPILRYFLLDKRLAVASNLEQAVCVHLPEADQPLLIPFRETTEFLKHIPWADTIELLPYKDDGQQVLLLTDRAKAKLESADPKEFPPVPKLEPQITTRVNGDALVAGLNEVVHMRPQTTPGQYSPGSA